MGDPPVCEVRDCRVQKLGEYGFERDELCESAEKNQLIAREVQQIDFVVIPWIWPPNEFENIRDSGETRLLVGTRVGKTGLDNSV